MKHFYVGIVAVDECDISNADRAYGIDITALIKGAE
jgi:hypothetical protein